MLTDGNLSVYSGYFESLPLAFPYPCRKVAANDLPRALACPSDRTLPDHGHAPACGLEARGNRGVSLSVFFDLLPPKVLSCSWHPEERAIVPVPEAAVEKNHDAAPWQDEIGLAKECGVEREAQAEPVKTGSEL
jgi:hypothetical protein